MRMNFLLATILIAAIVVISGCTSPSPAATVSPTALPTALPTSTPSLAPTATAVASAVPGTNVTPTPAATSSGAASTSVGNLAVSGVSIDWDTMDTIQHDTAYVTLQNVGTSLIQDVTVTYTASTPSLLANTDGTSSIVSQPVSTSIYVGKISPTEVKSVVLPSLDHSKNGPATVTIKVSWKDGEGTILQGTLSAPDYKLGNKAF
jgi:hypothetical protein